MAPLEVQKAAGCRIGINYPNPIIDHATAGFLCCEKLRSVMDMVHQRPGPSSLKAHILPNRAQQQHHPCSTQHMYQQQQHPAYGPLLGVIQTHLQRYHPYSHPQGTNLLSVAAADSLLNPIAERNDSTSESIDTLCQNTNSRPNPECCTVCTSADNLMTRLLLHEIPEQERIQKGSGGGRPHSSCRRSSPHRTRRRSPPSVCSHKLSDFATIT